MTFFQIPSYDGLLFTHEMFVWFDFSSKQIDKQFHFDYLIPIVITSLTSSCLRATFITRIDVQCLN